MPSCAVPNCKNRYEKGFRLFRLPVNEHRKKQWLINMGRETWTPPKSTSICETHFEESQWEQNRADGWKKLKPNAIPTLFDNSMFPVTVIKTEEFQICRICLKIDDDLMDLFKPALNNEIPYLELMEHTSLQVSSDDGLPPYICNECFQMLKSIKSFKEKCIQSDNLLRNYNGPNTVEKLIEYILSKTQVEGIWYVDNEDDPAVPVDKHESKEKNEQLNDKIQERLGKLDEFLDKQLEILQEPMPKIDQFKQNKCPVNKNRIQSMKSPSNNSDNLSVITEGIEIPKVSSKYELQDFVCHVCGKKVKYFDSHMKIHKSSLDYKCEICGKQFRQALQLRKHLIVHKADRKYECSICHIAFTRAQVRNRHIQTVHEKTRQFQCTVCSKSFHLAYRLKVHMVTHTGEKRYKCDIEGCNRRYTQRTPLIKHKLQNHSINNGINGTTNFQCEICAKLFKHKRFLDAHLRLHDASKGKTFQCTMCIRTFQKQNYLQEHLRLHMGTRPAKCIKCNKSFVSDRVLKRHMKTHISTVFPSL